MVQSKRNGLERYMAELMESGRRRPRARRVLERFLHDHLGAHRLRRLDPGAARDVSALATISQRLHERPMDDWRGRAGAYVDLTDEQLDERKGRRC